MRRLLLLFFLILGIAGPAAAGAPDCEALAAAAERKHGLPEGLLRAIARTESGRRAGRDGVRAWPWTANVAGKGMYFDDPQTAIEHLSGLAARNMQDFDVGCMQINYRWHGVHFANIEQMIEPARNTDYAARYLKELRRETGDWDSATRFYHSRDPARGAAYLGRVRNALARIDTSQPPSVPVTLASNAVDVPSSRPDRRFKQSEPLLQRASATEYWLHPTLPEGVLPKMP